MEKTLERNLLKQIEIMKRKLIKENPIEWNELAEVDQESEDAFQRAFLMEPRFNDQEINIVVVNPLLESNKTFSKNFTPPPKPPVSSVNNAVFREKVENGNGKEDIVILEEKLVKNNPVSKVKHSTTRSVAMGKIAKQMESPKSPVKINSSKRVSSLKTAASSVSTAAKKIVEKRNLPKIIEECIVIDPVKIVKSDVGNNVPNSFEKLIADLQITIDDTDLTPKILPNSSENPIPLPEDFRRFASTVAKLPGGPWAEIPVGPDRFRLWVDDGKWALRLDQRNGRIRHAKKTL